MKTSFYFVIWAAILFMYLQFIECYLPWNIARYGFEITWFLVFCIYWIFNHIGSTQNRFLYEKKLRRAETIVRKGTTTETNGKIFVSCIFNVLIIIYFIVSSIFIARTIYHSQVEDWWGLIDWIGLAIFVLFSCRIIIQHIDKLDSLRHVNLITSEENFISIDEVHNREFIDNVISYEPRKFRLYQQTNLVFSIISILLGSYLGIVVLYLFMVRNSNRTIGMACIFYLYASLSIYYGVKDFISSSQSLRRERLILYGK